MCVYECAVENWHTRAKFVTGQDAHANVTVHAWMQALDAAVQLTDEKN